jgi:hypothetical protein
MNYILISDVLWYAGHILSGISIIFTHDDYYLAVPMVIVAQFVTIISRPIGRIKRQIQEIEQNDNNV